MLCQTVHVYSRVIKKDVSLYNPWVAVLLAVFMWWFLTGIILFLVRWADNRFSSESHSGLVYATLPILVISFYGFFLTTKDNSLLAVYGAFLSALLIWGWFELAFLSGFLTGPSKVIRPINVFGWERFRLACASIAYSELALACVTISMIYLVYGRENLFGLYTFLLLYFARLSAKLNLFFGVPNINFEFLPFPVKHLASHFKIAQINWFFPFSITGLSITVAVFFEKAIAQPNPSESLIGFSLLAALTILALIEHWFMVLPIPDQKLWSWIIPKKINQGETSAGNRKEFLNKAV